MKNIKTVEKVQKRVTKQVKQLKHLCYYERFKGFNLPTLRYRRHSGDMIEVFKILHAEVSKGILKLSFVMTTRGHSLKLYAKLSRLEIRRNSFAVKVLKA